MSLSSEGFFWWLFVHLIYHPQKNDYPPINLHSNGISPSLIGSISSKGPCFIAMLDYRSVENSSVEGRYSRANRPAGFFRPDLGG